MLLLVAGVSSAAPAAAPRQLVWFAPLPRDGIRPDLALFQSWNDKPDYILPETKPHTFTWLIDRYFVPRPG